jgi:hypothetical protein
MNRNWITVLNILLVLAIFVTSLSIPDMTDDAEFTGTNDNERKLPLSFFRSRYQSDCSKSLELALAGIREVTSQ